MSGLLLRRLLHALIALLLIAACTAEDPQGPDEQPHHVDPDASEVADAEPDTDTDDRPPLRDKPLDLFVADNTHFEYKVIWQKEGPSVTVWLLEVTSQHWLTHDEVDDVVWTHDVILALPKNATTTSTALAIVEGSSTPTGRIEKDSDEVQLAEIVAKAAQTPAIGILQIPKQPLTLKGIGENLYEDAMIAPSWLRSIETKDPTWSAYFPMARGVVRALDAVQDFMEKRDTPVENFVLTGFSKRGAATYLATAVDERVIAMAPGVFDFLNFVPQARHHLHVYGEPAPAVKDYAEYDLFHHIDTPEATTLLENSDPYAYRERYTMPKFILASPGDEFFLPDSMQFYLDDLPGETLVRYFPNAGHGLVAQGQTLLNVMLPLVAWYKDIVADKPRPTLNWTHQDNTLTLTTSPTPSRVRLWTATNEEARNFRMDVVGPIWESTTVEPSQDGTYQVQITNPDKGFTAYLLDATFHDQTYSTQVYVTTGQ